MHVSVDFKNDVEKDSTLLLFFFSSKSPAGHAISRQKHLELTVVSYLLLELFYIGMPVVKTDGRLDGRTVTWLPKFLEWMDYQILLGMGLFSSALRACVELRCNRDLS